MKLLFALLLLPCLSFCQKKSTKQELQELQAIADTMHFPDPFEFKYVDTVNLSKSIIYQKSLQWLTSVLGDIKRILQIQDSLNGKLVLVNVEAGYDIIERLTIDIKDGKYRLTLDDYMYYDSREDKRPLAEKKDSKTTRLDKYFIILRNDATFKSLKEYINKNDNF